MRLRAAVVLAFVFIQLAPSVSAQTTEDSNTLGLRQLTAAEAALDAMPVVADKVQLERTSITGGDYTAMEGGFTFRVPMETHAAYLFTVEYALLQSVADGLTRGLKEALLPFRQACEQIGGTLQYTDVRQVIPRQDLESFRQSSLRLQRSQLTGQHECLVSGVPTFAVVAWLSNRMDMMMMPPGYRYRMVLVTLAPNAIEQVRQAARMEAQAFAKATEDLRRDGKAGSPVQIDANAIPVAALTSGTRTGWICALLVDRKEGLMQVQIGATSLFVPTGAVVPQVLKAGERPGLPPACTPPPR